MIATTSTLPTPTGKLPESLAAARPYDADGVRLFLAESAGLLWPDHGDRPPYVVEAWSLRLPWIYSFGATLSVAGSPDFRPLKYQPIPNWVGPGDTSDYGDYARWMSWFFLALAGSAAMVAKVTESDLQGPWSPDEWPADMWGGSPAVFSHGVAVQLDSWAAMSAIDPASLWFWSAADRATADARRDRRERETALEATFPGALTSAQALHDALQLLLPHTPEIRKNSSKRKGASWR